MSAPAMVETRKLHSYYGTSHILHGIDFSVRRGEAVGLMGRNGMGKRLSFARCSVWCGRAAAKFASMVES